jgi:hypothetical protein
MKWVADAKAAIDSRSYPVNEYLKRLESLLSQNRLRVSEYREAARQSGTLVLNCFAGNSAPGFTEKQVNCGIG